jgi:hypothetical protein
MAKDAFRDTGDKGGLIRNSDSWAWDLNDKNPDQSGKKVNSKPTRVPDGMNKPGDSRG